MKRFRRHGTESQRDRLKQELFQFTKTVEHGFPHQPSALGYSSSLQLMAIGTRSGAIKLYGAPGVEFMGLHDENAAVTQVFFMPHQVELVTLLDDNSLHMWTLRSHKGLSELLEIGRFLLTGPPGAPPSVTRVTAVLTHSSGELLLLGTEGGHVFIVEVPGFRELEEMNISLDQITNWVGHWASHTSILAFGSISTSNLIPSGSLEPSKLCFQSGLKSLVHWLQGVPDDYIGRRNLEHVEALQENPVNSNQVAIGYGRGLMVIWDLDHRLAIRHIPATQQLESMWWTEDGSCILSSHSEGSYCCWTLRTGEEREEEEKSNVPYGHFPCKAINKIIQLPTAGGPPFLLFSGGMPRASYGDRHCITVIYSKTQVAFDFTSRIIDFFVTRDGPQHTGEPSALVVLVEEELVVIDLQTEGWPVIQTPYLVPLHSSAITCSHHVSAIPLKLWERIIAAGVVQNTQYSKKPWPITGGQNLALDPPQRDLLLTGHEDGTVRFWDASGVCLYPLYKLSTAAVFNADADLNDNMSQGAEGEWPPFRKVGCFDPYSDDPRLGIQKIHLCKYSGYLTVAGTAGQILMLELNDEAAEQTVEAKIVDLLQGQEGFRWKGHTQLDVREEPVLFPPGFQPFTVVQCQPPAVVTALNLHSEWKLIAFGTSHGFGVYDYLQKNNVLVRCTLNPSDQLAMEGPLSRVKSIKKSLRQSFRRIRRSRVSLRKHHISNTNKIQEANARLEAELAEMELAPVQRKIEARSSDDSFTGLVRTLYFADTFLSDSSHNTPSVWAGTNGGTVFAYILYIPPVEQRADEALTAQPAKEIQLMHRAPVVGIVVLDGHGAPLPEPLETAHDLARSPDLLGSHHVLVISEEQFKVFTLPKLSSKMKLKLTAVDGSRVRRVGLAWFGSSRTEDYGESGLVFLTNQGDVHVLSLPHIKMQIRYPCIRREDVSGIASCVFTKQGQGFYLMSPSEFERFSLSTRHLVEPRCLVEAPLPPVFSNQHQPKLEGASSALRCTQDTEDAESAARHVMEHALLNDEKVLLEIQKSLEGDHMAFPGNNVKNAVA